MSRYTEGPPTAAGTAAPPLETRGLHKSYVGGDGSTLEILKGVDLAVGRGEAVAIVGASGAGKSTLLHLLGALDRPTSGEVCLGGRDVAWLDEEELARVRNRHIGFVFQFHHLLREFTALENVMMPALLGGEDAREAERRARALLAEVGLEGRLTHRPRQLSGGEQQRVAVARALVNEPLVLLADEPSGNLDTQTSHALHELLFGLRRRREVSLVIVTHNADLAHRADRILRLEDGRLQPTTRV
ncbi:MAG TPA: ABC transporter ATP-binding protein [Longimicrobiales bacterium]|nr:ABC transporter ATP-binding protein [Longimicrobiales bacterium]